ncbi:hypothetical protein ACHAXR_006489, partial [Thalassiosira sp. AJA248-18]
CRAVAAVVVGNPEKVQGVPVTGTNRWQLLHDGTVDILVYGDTHTIEREVKETSTGAGFTFSSVYNYDGLVYFGNPNFVKCAEERKRYGECSSLMICVTDASTHVDYLEISFPSDFLLIGSSLEHITDMLFDNTCNVIAHEKSVILNIASSDGAGDNGFIFGNNTMTKEPLAIVTRNNDREFSDIINWVVQALIFGEEQGLAKDPTLCQNSAKTTFFVSDMDFMNAIYCVGNYGEIFDGEPKIFDGRPNSRGMNQINNGTGMLYAIPFGNLDKENIVNASSTITRIRNKGSFDCGLDLPGTFDRSIKAALTGVEYCRTLAAAFFNGDPTNVNFITYEASELSAYIALAKGEIDVLVGGMILKGGNRALKSLFLLTTFFFAHFFFRNSQEKV